MRLLLLAAFLLISNSAFATTYYITKAGNDSTGTGAIGSPWLTIQKCLNTASNGDICQVNDTTTQTYYERLTFPTSGVTVRGARSSPANQYLTIVDGSEPVTGTWTHTGSGVYRMLQSDLLSTAFMGSPAQDYPKTGPNTGLTNEPCLMTANGKDIMHINYYWSDGGATSNWGTALTALARASTDDMWDGVDALFANVGGYTYVSFADDTNPNTMSIRVAPHSYRCGYEEPVDGRDFATFMVDADSYITIEDFEIQGNVQIQEGSTNITLNDNKIHGSDYIVFVWQSSNVTISNNIIYGNAIGFDSVQPQAWSTVIGPLSSERQIAANQYATTKLLIGINDSPLIAILNSESSGTTITGNETYNALGISMYTVSGTTTVTGNTTHNSASICFFSDYTASGTIYYGENLAYDCDSPLRFKDLEDSGSAATYYIYKNRVYSDTVNVSADGAGFGIDMQTHDAGNGVHTFYIYHNTFIGGAYGIMLATISGYGLPNVLIFNNIVQITTTASGYVNYSFGGMCDSAARLKSWAYNWHYGTRQACDWVDEGNVTGAAKIFADSTMPASWTPSGTALNAAVDCDESFVINSVTYSAMPAGCAVGDTMPDMGAVQTGEAQPVTWTADDDFDSGTTGADLDGRTGGSNWADIAGTLNGNWQKDPYAEWVTDGAFTTEDHPGAPMTGKAIRCASANPCNYYRSFASISEGIMAFYLRPAEATPDDEVLVSFFGNTTWGGGVRVNTTGDIVIITTAETEVDTGANVNANTSSLIEMEWDLVGQPCKYRARVDSGSWTSWTTMYACLTFINNISIQERDSGTTAYWFDEIQAGPVTPGSGTITFSSPTAGSTIRVGEAVSINFATEGITSGNVTIHWSMTGCTDTARHTIGTPAYNAGTQSWTVDAPSQQIWINATKSGSTSDCRLVNVGGGVLSQ